MQEEPAPHMFNHCGKGNTLCKPSGLFAIILLQTPKPLPGLSLKISYYGNRKRRNQKQCPSIVETAIVPESKPILFNIIKAARRP